MPIKLRRWGYRGRLSGLGDVCNRDDSDYDPVACEGSPPPVVPPSTACTCLPSGFCAESGNSCSYSGPGVPAGGITAPSANSTAWAAFAAQMLKAGLTLAEIQSIPAGTVVNPSGQIIRQAPGYPVPAPGTTSGAFRVGGAAISTNTLLLLAAVGIGAAFMMGSRR